MFQQNISEVETPSRILTVTLFKLFNEINFMPENTETLPVLTLQDNPSVGHAWPSTDQNLTLDNNFGGKFRK